MPFKDTPNGTTHYNNDGCGDPVHNTPTKETWEERWMEHRGDESCNCCQRWKRFITQELATARQQGKIEVINELVHKECLKCHKEVTNNPAIYCNSCFQNARTKSHQAGVEEERRKNKDIFDWLLGEKGDFPDLSQKAHYSFRKELRKKIAKAHAIVNNFI